MEGGREGGRVTILIVVQYPLSSIIYIYISGHIANNIPAITLYIQVGATCCK